MLLRQAAAQLSAHYKSLEELELRHPYRGLTDYDVNINNEKGGAGRMGGAQCILECRKLQPQSHVMLWDPN